MGSHDEDDELPEREHVQGSPRRRVRVRALGELVHGAHAGLVGRSTRIWSPSSAPASRRRSSTSRGALGAFLAALLPQPSSTSLISPAVTSSWSMPSRVNTSPRIHGPGDSGLAGSGSLSGMTLPLTPA